MNDQELQEQEKVMKEMFKKEMIRRIESKVAERDPFVMSKLRKLIEQDEVEEDF
ncbi:hypothetical protein OAQ99_03170 [Candidatus Kapabacteria bacterium]|nr:hypothetical protein [Candidatus Kapabacteria bacterium]